MGTHRSYPDIRRRNQARNYFGHGVLGHVRITSAGAQQSADGIAWSAISGWTLSASRVSIPATQDGDMVVLHCRSWQCDTGMTVTTSARCRGLLVYVQGNCVHNGVATMTGRGPLANPADAATSANTPVAPGDGHAVPADGLTLRRFATGNTSTDAGEDLLWGCGLAAVAAEANQPAVEGNGLVIRIPRIGGLGATAPTNTTGVTGSTAALAPGGGGSGGGHLPGPGAAATCFGGGAGGGGDGSNSARAGSGSSYCGAGGAGRDNSDQYSGGGAGNPGGNGGVNGTGDQAVNGRGLDGVGGLIFFIVGGDFSGGGQIVAGGSSGGGVANNGGGGGGSGGGVAGALYAGSNTFVGTLSAPGGVGGAGAYAGGHGAAGAVIGPVKIDPA